MPGCQLIVAATWPLPSGSTGTNALGGLADAELPVIVRLPPYRSHYAGCFFLRNADRRRPPKRARRMGRLTVYSDRRRRMSGWDGLLPRVMAAAG